MDFFDAQAEFAKRLPAYGGYTIALDRSRWTIQTTDLRSESLEGMREELLEVMEYARGTPEAWDAQGRTVKLRDLPFSFERVRFARRELEAWRALIREGVYNGVLKLSTLSISDRSNTVEVMVLNESRRQVFLEWMAARGIPNEAVRFSLGCVMPMIASPSVNADKHCR